MHGDVALPRKGGRIWINYLQEMFSWFFQSSFERKRVMEHAQNSHIAREGGQQVHRNGSDAWKSTRGPLAHAACHQTRAHVGKIWARNS